MRLTIDLIEKSASFINAVRDRELDMRGNRIPAIENFGAIKDQYDTIDLTDNEIIKLENFPKMNRLKTFLISSNQIIRVEPEVSEKLVALETLVLNNNKIAEFEDLEGLAECKALRYLSLMDNPITKKPHYRLTLISKLPQLRCLDFRKVTQAEKEAAEELNAADSTATGTTKTKSRSRKAVSEDEGPKSKRQKLSEKEIGKIKDQIKNAASLEEINRLERILETGYLL